MTPVPYSAHHWPFNQLPAPYRQVGYRTPQAWGVPQRQAMVTVYEDCDRMAGRVRRERHDNTIPVLSIGNCGCLTCASKGDGPVADRLNQVPHAVLNTVAAARKEFQDPSFTILNRPAVYAARDIFALTAWTDPEFWGAFELDSPEQTWGRLAARSLLSSMFEVDSLWAQQRATAGVAQRILGTMPRVPHTPGPETSWLLMRSEDAELSLCLRPDAPSAPPRTARHWRRFDDTGLGTALALAAQVTMTVEVPTATDLYPHNLPSYLAGQVRAREKLTAVLIASEYAAQIPGAVVIAGQPNLRPDHLGQAWRLVADRSGDYASMLAAFFAAMD